MSPWIKAKPFSLMIYQGGEGGWAIVDYLSRLRSWSWPGLNNKEWAETCRTLEVVRHKEICILIYFYILCMICLLCTVREIFSSMFVLCMHLHNRGMWSMLNIFLLGLYFGTLAHRPLCRTTYVSLGSFESRILYEQHRLRQVDQLQPNFRSTLSPNGMLLLQRQQCLLWKRVYQHLCLFVLVIHRLPFRC